MKEETLYSVMKTTSFLRVKLFRTHDSTENDNNLDAKIGLKEIKRPC